MQAMLLLFSTALSAPAPADHPTVLVVLGAEGTPEYGKAHAIWADHWERAARNGNAKFLAIGTDPPGDGADRELLHEALAAEPTEGDGPLWLVLIGHGTFDGKTARFNLRGPDLTPADLAQSLLPIRRRLAIVDCASSSAPFLNELSAPDRVVITATKSGSEQNYARFGEYFAEAIAGHKADFDKDGQTSLLEAFLTASRRAEDFYTQAGRLATEHALLDDNGDGVGTPATFFEGLRVAERSKSGALPDGDRAHQWHLVPSERERAIPPALRARRDRLELEISALRNRKTAMPQDDYYATLEQLLLKLARLYEEIDQSKP